jgi:hypothetical protein
MYAAIRVPATRILAVLKCLPADFSCRNTVPGLDLFETAKNCARS